MALLDIRHLIAVLRFQAVERVHASDRLDDLRAVETIFVVLAGVNEIAIFVVAGEIYELRILIIYDIERDARNDFLQASDLREYRAAEIDISTEFLRIPSVRPPAIRAVHREDAVGGIDRNDGLLAEVAGAAVETALISKFESALLAAIGAESGRRNPEYLSSERRCDLEKHRHIGVTDIECAGTLAANMLHRTYRSEESIGCYSLISYHEYWLAKAQIILMNFTDPCEDYAFTPSSQISRNCLR